ncbi:hypothetical protein BQ8794_50072 [Mesorhizobium prunaredense]|uniref:Uncharacterized protein n=1 Tax=Mesorhizobium prunaredense TaxID=1631249 RepID=A0A1R3VFD1_9HYPH|nr:hypothetical protein BQ8794_50072 [Mesorhizobium prunaredense]
MASNTATSSLGQSTLRETNLIPRKSESLVFVKPTIQLSGSGGAVRVWIIDRRGVKCRFPSLGH